MSRPDFDPGGSLSRDQLLAQIDTRLDVLRPLVDEYEQLSRARAVLGDGDAASALRGGAAGRASARARGGRRAPRGANRAAILQLAGQQPGITVAELFDATGIAKPTLHSTIYALTRRGELQRAGDGIKLAGDQAPAPSPGRRPAPASTASGRRAGRARRARGGSTARARARRVASAAAAEAEPATPAAEPGNAPAAASASEQ